ncbi:hypothetical protein SOJ65_18450 [Pseudomonas aeruginosa]|uniref:hypothetical protein n=1 Tax=Pseudomonas aeruginosa TaxID=287 RepID=UPI00045089DD|nr:hypothetical protein [Pseudomonas aeruginosa]ETV37711.1 hypothetical protein Q045_04472 [Pseudomonas aeruginosa BWHPSA040]MBK1501261.1 hypothetical protein [Pseudomonas aeruginosa]MCV0233362.1 hypothetical protein [Pseudomonas aeruginosa]MCW3885918.1 hypothetical protein [Pseudomonas aeruginosa]MDY1053049.1 hypothetical protein [Pseudomonas aeruginosa]
MDTKKAELKKKILELVNEGHTQKNQGTLLSTLGILITKTGIQLKEVLENQKLGDFIARELSEEIEIIGAPQNPAIKIALLRSLSPQSEDLIPEIKKSEPSEKNRYIRAIWSALSNEIDPGFKRVIKLGDHPQYKDIPESTNTPENHIELPSKFITTESKFPEEKLRIAELDTNIKRWAEESGISIESLVYKKQQREEKPQKSRLEKILSLFTQDELKRVTLPLDIVEKLLKE